MSGFGGVFAAIVVGIVFAGAISSIASASTAALLAAYSMPSRETGEEILIESGRIAGGSFQLNVTLLGPKSIAIKDLRYADIFITYYSEAGKVSEYLKYGEGWSVLRVFTGGAEGEIANPVRLDLGSGMWDPGETLELALQVQAPIASPPWSVVFSSPDGISSSRSFGG